MNKSNACPRLIRENGEIKAQNIDKGEGLAIDTLKLDDTILNLPADTSRMTLVVNKTDYIQKCPVTCYKPPTKVTICSSYNEFDIVQQHP